jgi:hypothetical protein
MKSFLLHIDLWKDSCWLVWPVTQKQAEYWYNKKFPKTKEKFTTFKEDGALSVMGENHVIFLTEWENNAECFGLLAHECVHIGNSILQSCEVKETDGKDETLAYLVDFMVRHFTAALTETKL